jgi:uncharacterized membrane protein YqjE
MNPPDRAPGGGWSDAARQWLGSLIEIGRTRIDLVGVELAEERLRIARLFLGAVLTLFMLGLGILLSVGALLLWCEPGQRLAVIGGLAALCLLAAAIAGWRWQGLAANSPPLLQATLAELQRDHQAWMDRSTR